MEKRAALGEEELKIVIPDEADHEEEEANGDEEKAGEGIGGLDEELVVRRGSQELGGGLDSVAERVDLLHVEHHQRPGRDRYERVQDADHRKCRRRRCHSHSHSHFFFISQTLILHSLDLNQPNQPHASLSLTLSAHPNNAAN